MQTMRNFLIGAFAVALAGCQTAAPDPEFAARQAAIAASIAAERLGDYFVARRFFKNDCKVWGWVRRPGQPWRTAQLVMLNEQRQLAPDRAEGTLGIDNNFEYHLRGHFSGDKVYEPASDRFYPEFVLTDYTLIDRTPPLIFRDRRSINPAILILEPPQ